MVEYIRHGSVAVLHVNNPPVNALSHHVRVGLKEGIEEANNDSTVKSIVIDGQRTFLAGADIKEFSSFFSLKNGTSLVDLCNLLESSKKPVICAINGFAFGGGLEVAISSHYRIATADSLFGFPEVELGILPAASGTQRFPRLVGLEAAMDIITSGVRFNAERALKLGLIDKVVKGDVQKEALKFATELSSASADGRRTSQLSIKDAARAREIYDKAVEKVARKYPGLLAPVFCIKAIMAAVETDSFESGMQKELENALLLFQSGQAAALQYAFFAQRKAVQWSLPGSSANSKTTEPRAVHSVGIIGLGTMGTGIAMATLNAGIPVVLLEYNNQALDHGMKALKALYEGSVKLGRLKRDQADRLLSQARGTINYNELKHVDLVIEAVFEKLSLKRNVFAKLDKVCKPEAILCTNTSGLSVDKIAEATSRRNNVIGAHFFAPAYYMKLLEIVRGQHTSPEAIATVSTFGKRLGKIPVVVGNCDGFVGNRMMRPLHIEAVFMTEEGASPHEIDQIMEDFGFAMGSFKVRDLSGLDITKYSIEEQAHELGVKINLDSREFNGSRFSPLPIILVNNGRLGRKSGSGWYNYESRGAKIPYTSQLVEDLIVAYRRQHGIVPQRIPPYEILERLLYSVVNEGFKVLEEQIAMNPEDIDTIFINGLGWPRQTGGPMYYARNVGLNKVYERICYYSQRHPTSPHWKPSALLKKMARENMYSNI